MTDRQDDPLGEVIEAFRRMPVPDPPDALLLFPRPAAPRATGEQADTSLSRAIWRILMRPTVRYGSAAAILVLAVGWLVLAPSRSFALGEVIRAAEKHKVVKYRIQWVPFDKTTMPGALNGTVYVDLLRPRSRFESDPEPEGEGEERQEITTYDRTTGTTCSLNVVWRTVDGPNGPVRVWSGTGFTMPQDLGQDGDGFGRFWTVSFHPAWGEVLPLGGVSDKTPFLDALAAMEKRKETTSEKVRLNGRQLSSSGRRRPNQLIRCGSTRRRSCRCRSSTGFPTRCGRARSPGCSAPSLCGTRRWPTSKSFSAPTSPSGTRRRRVIKGAQRPRRGNEKAPPLTSPERLS